MGGPVLGFLHERFCYLGSILGGPHFWKLPYLVAVLNIARCGFQMHEHVIS